MYAPDPDSLHKRRLPILAEVSARLLIDSLTMCQLEETEYLFELRFHCVKLYEQLIKDSEALSAESLEGVDAAIIELCLINWPAERNNQISSIFNRTLFKIMESFNPKKMIEYYPQFFSAFIDNDPRDNINRTRLLLGQLERIVIEKQKMLSLSMSSDISRRFRQRGLRMMRTKKKMGQQMMNLNFQQH